MIRFLIWIAVAYAAMSGGIVLLVLALFCHDFFFNSPKIIEKAIESKL